MNTVSTEAINNLTAAQRKAFMNQENEMQEKSLSDTLREKLEKSLTKVLGANREIQRIICLFYDNSCNATDICTVLGESLTLKTTPFGSKIGRLFLGSDTVHNFNHRLKKAFLFRRKLHEILPSAFESLNDSIRSLYSCKYLEDMCRLVLSVLQSWREHCVFSDEYLNGLHSQFLRTNTNVHYHSTSHCIKNFGLSRKCGRNPYSRNTTTMPHCELERKCYRAGLVTNGRKSELITRLIKMRIFLDGTLTIHSGLTIS